MGGLVCIACVPLCRCMYVVVSVLRPYSVIPGGFGRRPQVHVNVTSLYVGCPYGSLSHPAFQK